MIIDTISIRTSWTMGSPTWPMLIYQMNIAETLKTDAHCIILKFVLRNPHPYTQIIQHEEETAIMKVISFISQKCNLKFVGAACHHCRFWATFYSSDGTIIPSLHELCKKQK